MKERILSTAQNLTTEVKNLLAASTSGHGIHEAAAVTLKITSSLADEVKIGAAALSSDNQTGQVLLLNTVKDVSVSLSDLITSAKLGESENILKTKTRVSFIYNFTSKTAVTLNASIFYRM